MRQAGGAHLVVNYQVATSRTNTRCPYGSLLSLEGEGEDECRSKANDSYSDQTLTSILSPLLRGEAAFAKIE